MDGAQTTRERIIMVAEELLFLHGYSGTSLNDIMNAAELTKGAFFHHFRNKHDLAHTVLTRWADNDDALVGEFVARAHSLADDPLQEATIFIKLFEEWLSDQEQAPKGCLFASFTYESAQFEAGMHDYVKQRLEIWMELYAVIFERLAATKQNLNQPSGRQLTEMLATTFEGGLLLGRALDDRHYLVRQLQQFRHYLQMAYS